MKPNKGEILTNSHQLKFNLKERTAIAQSWRRVYYKSTKISYIEIFIGF